MLSVVGVTSKKYDIVKNKWRMWSVECCQCHRVNDQLPRAALTVDSPVYILESTRRGGRLVQFCSTFCPTHSQICPNTFSIMRRSPRKCNLNTSSIYSTVTNQFRFNYYQTYRKIIQHEIIECPFFITF